ncbi:MAG: DUF6263 family protein [bacterium]
MKKTCGLLLVMILMIIGCAGPKIDLKFNIEPGSVYNYKVITKQQISQTIQGKVVDMDQVIIMEYRYDVKEINDQGNTVVDIVYERIGYMQEGPLGNIDYKSWEDNKEIPVLAQGFASLVDQGFTMEISPQGSVVSIKGADKIIDKMIKDMDLPASDEMTGEIKQSMQNQFGDAALMETMKSMFSIYPDRPVGVGDSWQAIWNMSKGFPMILNNTWKIKEMNDTEVVLDVYTKVESNKEAILTQMGGMEMSYDLSGEQSGSMVLDRTTGWCTKSQLDQIFEGTIRASGSMFGGQEGLEWPIKVAGTVTIESSVE